MKVPLQEGGSSRAPQSFVAINTRLFADADTGSPC